MTLNVFLTLFAVIIAVILLIKLVAWLTGFGNHRQNTDTGSSPSDSSSPDADRQGAEASDSCSDGGGGD